MWYLNILIWETQLSCHLLANRVYEFLVIVILLAELFDFIDHPAYIFFSVDNIVFHFGISIVFQPAELVSLSLLSFQKVLYFLKSISFHA